MVPKYNETTRPARGALLDANLERMRFFKKPHC
jgi:hypothetical protein